MVFLTWLDDESEQFVQFVSTFFSFWTKFLKIRRNSEISLSAPKLWKDLFHVDRYLKKIHISLLLIIKDSVFIESHTNPFHCCVYTIYVSLLKTRSFSHALPAVHHCSLRYFGLIPKRVWMLNIYRPKVQKVYFIGWMQNQISCSW